MYFTNRLQNYNIFLDYARGMCIFFYFFQKNCQIIAYIKYYVYLCAQIRKIVWKLHMRN